MAVLQVAWNATKVMCPLSSPAQMCAMTKGMVEAPSAQVAEGKQPLA